MSKVNCTFLTLSLMLPLYDWAIDWRNPGLRTAIFLGSTLTSRYRLVLTSFPVRQPWRNTAIFRLLIPKRQMPVLHMLKY